MRAGKRLADERAELLRKLTECEDRTRNRGVARQLNRLRERVAGAPLESNPLSEEFYRRVQELHEAVFGDGQALEELYLQRLSALMDRLSASWKDRRIHMSIFDKLKSHRGKREGEARDEMIRSQEYEAEQNVFELQRKIISLSQTLKRQMDLFESKVKECAAMPADSYDYRVARQQAVLMRPRIAALEKQLQLYGMTLENNAQYQVMLEAGRMTFQLRNYMPDTAKADLLLKSIEDETRDIVGEMESMSSTLSSYGAATDQAMEGTSSALKSDDAFDARVEKQREEAAQKAAEEAARKAEEAAKALKAAEEAARKAAEEAAALKAAEEAARRAAEEAARRDAEAAAQRAAAEAKLRSEEAAPAEEARQETAAGAETAQDGADMEGELA